MNRKLSIEFIIAYEAQLVINEQDVLAACGHRLLDHRVGGIGYWHRLAPQVNMRRVCRQLEHFHRKVPVTGDWPSLMRHGDGEFGRNHKGVGAALYEPPPLG